jgi:prolipoprotein diacylglyceryltransferase
MNYLILLTEPAEPASFTFWFLTEAFFGLVVFVLLYFFIVKNPKINKPPTNSDENKD